MLCPLLPSRWGSQGLSPSLNEGCGHLPSSASYHTLQARCSQSLSFWLMLSITWIVAPAQQLCLDGMFLLPQHPLLFLNMPTVLSPNLFRFLWYQWLILGHRGPDQAKAEAGSSKAEGQQTVSKLCWGKAAVLIWECRDCWFTGCWGCGRHSLTPNRNWHHLKGPNYTMPHPTTFIENRAPFLDITAGMGLIMSPQHSHVNVTITSFAAKSETIGSAPVLRHSESSCWWHPYLISIRESIEIIFLHIGSRSSLMWPEQQMVTQVFGSLSHTWIPGWIQNGLSWPSPSCHSHLGNKLRSLCLYNTLSLV